MNFIIDRAELTAVTGIKRTRTFVLEKSGDFRVLSGCSGKSRFDLAQVLTTLAVLHGLPAPDSECVQQHARLVLEARLKKKG